MTRFVIDTSVAAKWFVPLSGEPLAVRLKADLVTADARLANGLAAHLPVK